MQTTNFLNNQNDETFESENSSFVQIPETNNLNNSEKKYLLWLKYAKLISFIIIIYLIEEIYFIVANNHILDRLVVCMRNIGVLITSFILSSLFIKKDWKLYKHQLFPIIIIVLISLFMIIFNAATVQRFKKIFNINFLYYFIIYILMGIELVLIKYLVDKQFTNIFLILGLKGLIGTVIFAIINIFVNYHEFFDFFDKLLSFENGEMFEEFSIFPKIIYILTFLILQYLKFGIIKGFSENHFLSSSMIADVFYFPFYLIEKFAIQKFPITTSSTFYLNNIFGIVNTILLLIFNEVIEVKFFGVEKDTYKNIDKRQALEIQLMNKDLKKLKADDYGDTDNNDNHEND